MIWIITFTLLLVYALSGIRIIKENTKGVVISLGRVTKVLNPGINWILWPFERIEVISSKIVTLKLEKQTVYGKNDSNIELNSSVIYKVLEPDLVYSVENKEELVKSISISVSKSKIGEFTSFDLIEKREEILAKIEKSINNKLAPYGLKVESFNIEEINIKKQGKKKTVKDNKTSAKKEIKPSKKEKIKEDYKEDEDDDFLLN